MFTNAYAHAPATNLTLVALMHGIYPRVSFRPTTSQKPDIKLRGLGEQLRQRGFATAFFSTVPLNYHRAGEFLAASGDFRHIRRLMTDRPHTFTVRSSNNRQLAAALVGDESVAGVSLDSDEFTVQTNAFAAFTLAAPRVARDTGVTLFELLPTDESLESVFSYLVQR